jgi:hypothetical protein
MGKFGEYLSEASSSKTPWKTLVGKTNWGLYDQPETASVSKSMTKEFSKLCSNAFKQLATGNITLDDAARGVLKSFMTFKKQYYELGADDTATDDIVITLISDIFGIPTDTL